MTLSATAIATHELYPVLWALLAVTTVKAALLVFYVARHHGLAGPDRAPRDVRGPGAPGRAVRALGGAARRAHAGRPVDRGRALLGVDVRLVLDSDGAGADGADLPRVREPRVPAQHEPAAVDRRLPGHAGPQQPRQRDGRAARLSAARLRVRLRRPAHHARLHQRLPRRRAGAAHLRRGAGGLRGGAHQHPLRPRPGPVRRARERAGAGDLAAALVLRRGPSGDCRVPLSAAWPRSTASGCSRSAASPRLTGTSVARLQNWTTLAGILAAAAIAAVAAGAALHGFELQPDRPPRRRRCGWSPSSIPWRCCLTGQRHELAEFILPPSSAARAAHERELPPRPPNASPARPAPGS